MKKRRNQLLTLIVTVAVSTALMWNFYIRPRQLFELGMTVEQIESALGKHVEVKHAASALSSPPQEEEKQNVTMSLVEVRRFATDLHLNSYNRVIFINFPFGADLGEHKMPGFLAERKTRTAPSP